LNAAPRLFARSVVDSFLDRLEAIALKGKESEELAALLERAKRNEMADGAVVDLRSRDRRLP
jgi:hypothetical protein